MVAKRLTNGTTAYYWRTPAIFAKAGFTLTSEAIGTDYGAAVVRARDLNQHLDDWRAGRGGAKDLDLQAGFGTLGWLAERYKHTPAWEKVSERSRYGYQWQLELLLKHTLKDGRELRAVNVRAISARAADNIYRALQKGMRGQRRLRAANRSIIIVARAWDAVRRHYPSIVPEENVFRGVELEHGKGTTHPATRSEAYALHAALVAYGLPHLAVVPLVCFELHQRPENVLAGHLTWNDYRPADRPNAIRIEHHKTEEIVWHQLVDGGRNLYPELTKYLDGLERIGVPVVLKGGEPAQLYKLRHARALVRKAADAAGLPAYLTLAACRHGGLTELGDAELTEQQAMAASGHKSPTAHRVYVKRTERQRLAGAKKRRNMIERSAKKGTKRAPISE